MEQHILVPVDTSSSSGNAFEYVLEEIPQATITLLHVINPLSVFNYVRAEGFDYEKSEERERERRETVEQIFAEYRDEAAAYDREIHTTIEAGNPAEKILEYAEREAVDHIVMGSRGRSNIEEAMLGSVARSVVKRATIPVTIIPS